MDKTAKSYIEQKIEQKLLILDKSKPLLDYLNKVLVDEDGNVGYVFRLWSGELVRDPKPTHSQFDGSLGYSYHYENIVYGEPKIKSIPEDVAFNKEGEITIIGTHFTFLFG